MSDKTQANAAPSEQEIKALQDRLDNAPLAGKLIAALGAGHITIGSSWGFDKDLNDNAFSDFRKVKEDIQNDKEARSVLIPFDIVGGGLIDITSLDYALQTYRALVGNRLIDDKLITQARGARNEALAELLKFCQEGKTGTVGFYNTNKTSTITIHGQTAPSFRLNVKDFLGILAQHGYSVETSKGTKATAAQAYQGVVKFMSELRKAPSSNAVLVKIYK